MKILRDLRNIITCFHRSNLGIMDNLEDDICYSFPAIRAMQAGSTFYITTCPLRLIPRIFVFDEQEVPPEHRAQRKLNKSRIPEMSRYLVDNSDNYVFSALTASIDSEVHFVKHNDAQNMGILKVSMNSRILINDGQHRRAAIEEAINERPELGQDHIGIVFLLDEGLERSQQVFADLNQHSTRPSLNLATLYDDRDPGARLAKYLARNATPFIGLTEMEGGSVSSNSNKIFALSAIKYATRALLGKDKRDDVDEEERQLALSFWNELNSYITEWQQIQNKTLSISEFKQEYIVAHGIGLQALAQAGRDILDCEPHVRLKCFEKLSKIDWRKTNPIWSEKAMQGGRLSKSSRNIFLTTLEIKRQIGLSLNDKDVAREKELLAS